MLGTWDAAGLADAEGDAMLAWLLRPLAHADTRIAMANDATSALLPR
jgi:hypothetical protein